MQRKYQEDKAQRQKVSWAARMICTFIGASASQELMDQASSVSMATDKELVEEQEAEEANKYSSARSMSSKEPRQGSFEALQEAMGARMGMPKESEEASEEEKARMADIYS